jgi:hypothetical protein
VQKLCEGTALRRDGVENEMYKKWAFHAVVTCLRVSMKNLCKATDNCTTSICWLFFFKACYSGSFFNFFSG